MLDIILWLGMLYQAIVRHKIVIILLITLLEVGFVTALAVRGLDSRSSRNRRGTDDEYPGPRLKLAQVLFRHGDRSPIQTFKTDLHTEADWPQGYGQLSTTGMQQAYDLGDFLKQNYIDTQPDFLDPGYDRTQVYVRSTSFDRTLMTAYSVLAGLFPPLEDNTWNEEIPWQPIPVHTMPIEEDRMLVTDVDCPAFQEAQNEYRNKAQIFEETVQNYKDLYKYLSVQTGYPATWGGIRNILDPIYCEVMSNYTLPDWATDDVLDGIHELRDIYAGGALPPHYAYLKGGMLLGEMLDHMKNVSADEGEVITERLYLYSAHDSTIVVFLMTLGVFNDRHPPYTGCVMVELWEQPSGEYTVLISYRNETDAEPYPLQLPGCDVVCPLDTFIHLVQSSIPDDFEKACGITSSEPIFSRPPSGATIAVAIMTGALLLVVLIGGILCCVKRNKQQDNHDYKLVPMEMD